MKGLKKLIAGVAPTLASALGGPFAGTAAKFIANKLLGKDDASEAELSLAIASATPEELGNLKKIDNDFSVEMGRQGIDIYALEVDDRKDARSMAKLNMWPQIVLSVIFIGGYFGLLYMLFSGKVEIPESMQTMANILIGVMTANIPQIMSFWFGSSHGSKSKNPQSNS